MKKNAQLSQEKVSLEYNPVTLQKNSGKWLCPKHKSFDDELGQVIECNDCNFLRGYCLVSKDGAVFLMNEMPNFWPTEEEAIKFAKKWSIYKSWKPRQVSVIID